MKFFVTGGAGFIGSHAVDALLSKGEVTAYDNLTSGSLDHLTGHLGSPAFRFVKGDLKDLRDLVKAMQGHDVVFHFASNPDIARGIKETDLDIREGTYLTYNVLEAMRINRICAILYTSGSGVYGDVGTFPTAENFGPLLPISLYGASKLACEALISAFCHLFEIRSYIFRLANVVGQRQTHGVAYDFIQRLLKNPKELEVFGDGTQSKSYIHVDDAIAAMLFVFERATDRVNIFNVATGDYVDVNTIARAVLEEMGLGQTKIHYSGGDRGWKGDVPKVRFNLGKIEALGWRANSTSLQAIRKSIREMLDGG